MDGVVEQVPGLPHHEHTKIGYFDEGDQEFKNVRHPSMDLKSETENRKLACARVLIKARYENQLVFTPHSSKGRLDSPNWMFFGKTPKRPLTPPPLPIFGNYIALFFAKVRKYALTCVNLQ